MASKEKIKKRKNAPKIASGKVSLLTISYYHLFYNTYTCNNFIFFKLNFLFYYYCY